MMTLLFIVGIVFLVLGAEWLVRGASKLARLMGVSPLVIGLTVVAFGTSAPELAVSLSATLQDNGGAADIALGNVVGSNIANVLLILGASALIVPLLIQQQLIRIDVPLMIGSSLLVGLMCIDGRFSTLDGWLCFSLLLIWVGWLVRGAIRQGHDARLETVGGAQAEDLLDPPEPPTIKTVLRQIGLVVLGLTALVVGSNWLVDGAVGFAKYLGVSELIIGLTIVAVGTSLPEVATSLLAAWKGERDIAVGNVVGSNIFNLLCVLALTGIVTPGGLQISEQALWIDVPVMVGVALICLPIFFTHGTIARWEGGVLLFYYLAYVVYLVLDATNHAHFGQYQLAMLIFCLPLTVLAFGLSVAQHVRNRLAARITPAVVKTLS